VECHELIVPKILFEAVLEVDYIHISNNFLIFEENFNECEIGSFEIILRCSYCPGVQSDGILLPFASLG